MSENIDLSSGIWDIFGSLLENTVSSEFEKLSPELKKQLLEVKQWIADEYVNKLAEKNPILIPFKPQISLFLVNDWSAKQKFFDLFREHSLYKFFEWINELDQFNHLKNVVKKELDWVDKIPTSEELNRLKSEIMDSTTWSVSSITWEASSGWESTSSWESLTQESYDSDAIETVDWNWEWNYDSSSSSQYENSSQGSQGIQDSVETWVDKQSPFIENVYKTAASQIGVKYTWWGTSPETWFDCSWLWNWAFKQQWIKFKGRLTAAAFSWADVDVSKDQVRPWDFMYWDQKPGKKKHSPIYHIEMVVSKPFVKNWKRYVRTLWCSTDSKDDCGNRVWRGVSIRIREMKDYRHFWRPPYYYQLAEYEKTWQKDALVATANKPSADVAEKVA